MAGIPTIKDIASRAGVSVATVSYVLNASRYVSPERKERVLLAIKELNYVPNAVARGLRVRSSRTLGLIVSDITNPFYPDLARACEDVAYAAGYTLIMMNAAEHEERFAAALSQAREGRVDGLIVASARSGDRQALDALIQEQFPLVLAHRRVPGLAADTVTADNFSGAYAATRHLIGLGHRRIGMVLGVTNSSASTDRVDGYAKAMADAGLPLHPDWKVNGEARYQLSYTAAMPLMRMPAGERPTAVLVASDYPALAVMDAADEMGLRIPEDLAVVGFDDVFFAASRRVELTTVSIPRYQIGEQAARLLLDRISGKGPQTPVELLLPTKLIVRKTCGTGLM